MPPRPSTTTPLSRLLAVVDAAAVLVLLVTVPLLPGADVPLAHVAAAAAVLLLGRSVRIPLRLGERRVLVYAYAEGSIALALVLAGPLWLPVLVGLVSLAIQLPRRLPLFRAAYNVSALVVPCAAGSLVYGAVTRGHDGLGHLALALVLAAPAITLLNLLAISAVVAAAHGEPLLAPVRQDVVTELGGLALQLGLTVGLVACWRGEQYVGALLLPFVAAVAVPQLLRRLDVVTERDALSRLEQASRNVRTLDLDEAAAELLTRAEALFGVRQAQIVVDDGCGAPDVRTLSGPPVQDGGPEHRLVRTLVEEDPRVELVLVLPRAPQLSEAEQQVLSTFVASASTAVQHCLAYERQARAARTDTLTGLGNRLALQEEVAAATAPYALLLLDLDRFTQVNETLGYAVGDRLLQEVGARLRLLLRGEDSAVRLGSDEFVLHLAGLPGERAPEVARRRAAQLLAALQRPLVLDGMELPVEACVGVATGAAGDGVDEVLRRADVALNRAKSVRNAVVVHEPAHDEGAGSLRLLGQLRAALRQGELEVHHQPVFDLSTGALVSTEALVRWRHPEEGLLMPGAFIPAVEQTALVLPLTLHVLEAAVRQTVRWGTDVVPGLAVAVNVSPRCLVAPDFAHQVLVLLSELGLPAERLTLEITETLALADLDVVDRTLDRLRDAGVQLSLDDFGTGYSSMRALSRLPVHEVKVDRQFVAGAVRSPGDRAIIEATVILAHGLGLTVVAEGIETAEQHALVRALGCDRAQGYLLGRPGPAAALTAHLLPRQRGH
ncbi:MAG: histidine kinase [Frankiales bacterium]|nr:histidine kinase [Frankiales bacterium]